MWRVVLTVDHVTSSPALQSWCSCCTQKRGLRASEAPASYNPVHALAAHGANTDSYRTANSNTTSSHRQPPNFILTGVVAPTPGCAVLSKNSTLGVYAIPLVNTRRDRRISKNVTYLTFSVSSAWFGHRAFLDSKPVPKQTVTGVSDTHKRQAVAHV